MKLINLIKQGFNYLKNQDIEIRIRMLFFLEYAAFFACIIGTIAMLAFTVSPIILIPNFVLILTCTMGIFLSHKKKMYDQAAMLIVGGCAYIALPFMFFTAGGNKSGMPIWFLFGVIFICMMMKGKWRVIMSGIGILIAMACMLIGYYYPEGIIPLENGKAEFMDMLQSFGVVSVIVCICLLIYISAYDKQRELLLMRTQELKEAMYSDALTGIPNRHMYYDDTNKYSDDSYKEQLILVAMDVNGLKRVNDTLGHAAGDELIKNAAAIMTEAYSKLGVIYRTGGDEFVAILNDGEKSAEAIGAMLEAAVNKANESQLDAGDNGEIRDKISIAWGVAIWRENKEKSFFELEKLADTNMYQNKSKFYRESGTDRRRR